MGSHEVKSRSYSRCARTVKSIPLSYELAGKRKELFDDSVYVDCGLLNAVESCPNHPHSFLITYHKYFSSIITTVIKNFQFHHTLFKNHPSKASISCFLSKDSHNCTILSLQFAKTTSVSMVKIRRGLNISGKATKGKKKGTEPIDETCMEVDPPCCEQEGSKGQESETKNSDFEDR
ncbi:hypothetical protein LIER_29661 [Lithospermum erythrorhizon]|uniref:Uncharacterized protein n=1 Tax=Lithospermum erythrorhizon TaxID=34254 RepID=A0AAV3RNE2_LITER